jgi:hypothetical protein
MRWGRRVTMIDIRSPTSQFHPYQRPEAEKKPLAGHGFGDMFDKARLMARGNPAMLLGGLAAVALGAGLLRKKRLSR